MDKPYSHKSTTTKKKVDDYIFVPPPPSVPRPPSSAPPPPSGPRPPSMPRPPSTPHPRYQMTGVSDNNITKHQALVNKLLPKRGPRPDIIPDNTPPIPNKIYKTTKTIGKRTTWNVWDNEDDVRPSKKRPDYHDDKICGSGFDGLATTIEYKLNNRQINEAIDQLNDCIAQRNVTTWDKTHKNVILILENLLRQVKNYEDPDILNDVINNGGFIVRYYEHIGMLSFFVVEERRYLSFIPQRLSGGKYKKTYKKRNNKTKYSRKRKYQKK
jgi:hypothetical protein